LNLANRGAAAVLSEPVADKAPAAVLQDDTRP